jgi:enoyl-CoA hydratase/carnithine racemase
MKNQVLSSYRAHSGCKGVATRRRSGAGRHATDEALRIADAIAAQAPLAVVATRQNVRKTVEVGPLAAAAEFIDVQRKLANSEDAAEGVRAFVERRAARFSGR